TISLVQGYLDRRAATVFAKQYVGILKEGTIAEAVFYQLPPFQREDRKPDEIYKELQGQPGPSSLESRYGPTLKIKERLSSDPGEDIHFVKIETTGAEDLATYAAALIELHGPGTKKFPEKEQFAMLLLKGVSDKG